jgi:hypothetical protein
MGLLNTDGTPSAGGDRLEGIALGPALSTSPNPLSHYGKLEVFWNEGRSAFGACYDSEPTVYNGHSENTTPLLSYAIRSGEDGLVAQTTYAATAADGFHSLTPTCAVRGATNLVLWNDNREEGKSGTWQGEVYGATITCE